MQKKQKGAALTTPETKTNISIEHTTPDLINVCVNLKYQLNWLKKLQNLSDSKPILTKCLEGKVPKDEDGKLLDDPDLYYWNYFKDVMHKAIQPIYTRGTLPFEIVIDFDVKYWKVLKQEGDKLIAYLKSENIPYLLAYSGGNGIHVHAFLQPLDFNLQHLKEFDVDVARAVRSSVCYAILQDANVKPADIGLDKKKINFSKSSKGSQVREFGTVRPDGRYKTLIDEIPTEWPEVNPPLVFPSEVIQWNLLGTRYHDVAREAVISAIEKAKTENEHVLVDADFADTKPMQYPCVKFLVDKGLDNNRYYGAGTVILMSKKCNTSKKEGMRLTKIFLGNCKGLNASDVELRLNNVSGMWEEDRALSCNFIKDNIDHNLCKFQDCPICAKLENKKRNVEIEAAIQVKSVDEIIIPNMDLIPPINFDGLPNYNFIKMFVDYLAGIKDSYPEFAFQNGLAMLSAMVMGRVFVRLNGEAIFTNLFLLSMGLSGYARKTGPITIAGRVVKNSVGDIFLPADTTPEGIIAEMADIIETKKTRRDGSLEIVRDAQGIEGQPRKALFALWKDEAGQHYAQLQKAHMQGLTEAYCYFHGCPEDYTKRLSAKRIIIDGPIYFGMNMTTTIDSFKKYMHSDEIGTGFLPRHLIVAPEYTKQRMDISEDSDSDYENEDVITEMLGIVHKILPKTPLNAQLQDGVLGIVNKWAKEREEYFAKERDEQMSSLFAKLPSQVIRMAILIELGNIPQYIYEQLKEIDCSLDCSESQKTAKNREKDCSYKSDSGQKTGNNEQLKKIDSSYSNLQEQSYEQSISNGIKTQNQPIDSVFDVGQWPKTIVLEKIALVIV